MNTFFIKILSIFFAIVPIVATAQVSVKSAFDAIIKRSGAVTAENHTLEKDPQTNIKTSQLDLYGFVLPKSEIKLINNVISAIGNESNSAYNISQGKIQNTETRTVNLAIGDASLSVTIACPGYEYIYALFLAPSSEDPSGIYRYAYGIGYKEEDGKLIGTLAVTYATTLKYRQEAERKNSRMLISEGTGITDLEFTLQQTWFDKIMSYLQGMRTTSNQARTSLASKALRLALDADKEQATEAEKNAVREILKGMVSDKQYCSDNMVYTLLNQCLVVLK